MQRTIFRGLAALALAAAFSAGAQAAGAYPDKPITFIVPSAAGGSPDVLSRLITTQLAKDTGATLVVENRPGAAGNIGIALVKRAAPDGYTVGYGNINTLAVNRSLFKRLPYDVDQDLTPVAHMFDLYNALIVPADSPVKSVQDLIDRARKEPGRLSYGASGVGTTGHMGGELFKSMAGVSMQHVPYKGAGPALNDLLGNQISIMFDNLPSSSGHIKSGTLRALGVTTAERASSFPDLPTIAETVPGYETYTWNALFAPAGTPAEAIDKLNAAAKKALADPGVAARMAEFSAKIVASSPEELKTHVAAEIAKWEPVVKNANVQMD